MGKDVHGWIQTSTDGGVWLSVIRVGAVLQTDTITSDLLGASEPRRGFARSSISRMGSGTPGSTGKTSRRSNVAMWTSPSLSPTEETQFSRAT